MYSKRGHTTGLPVSQLLAQKTHSITLVSLVPYSVMGNVRFKYKKQNNKTHKLNLPFFQNISFSKKYELKFVYYDLYLGFHYI